MTIVVLNFDMEAELSGARTKTPRKIYNQLQHSYFWIVPLLGQLNETEVDCDSMDLVWLTETDIRWTDSMREICRRLRWSGATQNKAQQSEKSLQNLIPWGITPTYPSNRGPTPDVVNAVHSKQFAHKLSVEMGVALPGACVVTDSTEFEAAVRALNKGSRQPQRWIMKACYSAAGRDTCLGSEAELDGEKKRWFERQTALGPLIFQAYLDRKVDFSMLAQLSPGGELKKLALTLAEVSGRTYHSSLVADWSVDLPELRGFRDQLEDRLSHAGTALAKVGYFGPFGIDGLIDCHDRCFPLLEINARFTMGRAGFELKRRLAPELPCAVLTRQNSPFAERAKSSSSEIQNLGSTHCFITEPSFEQLMSLWRTI